MTSLGPVTFLRGARWCGLGCLVACASSPGPEVLGDDYSLLGAYLPAALVEGGVLLAPVTEVYGDKDLSVDDTFIDRSTHSYAFTAATGDTLVHVVGARDYSPFQAFGHVTPDGLVERVPVPAGAGEIAYDPRTTEGSVWVRGVGLSDGALVAQCYLDPADNLFVAWSAGSPDTLRLFEGSAAPCYDGMLGRSARDDEFLLARAAVGSVTVERWTVTATGIVAAGSASLPTSATDAVAVFVEEIAPDTFVVVLQGAGSLALVQTARTDRVVPDTGASSAFRWDPEAEVLLLTSSSGGSTWDDALVTVPGVTDEGFTSVRSTRVFGASVAERSEPNPDRSELRVPLAYEARQFTADGFVVEDAPTTPCTERDACRDLGEAYLIGHVGPAAAQVGLYFVWGWDWNGAVVAAPLAR